MSFNDKTRIETTLQVFFLHQAHFFILRKDDIMQFRRFIAALCAASIAFTQTAILPISTLAAESDISAVQTLADGGDDGNAVGDADGDGGADIGGDSDGGDAGENGDGGADVGGDTNGGDGVENGNSDENGGAGENGADDNNGDVGGNGDTDGDGDINGGDDSDNNGEADDADDNADEENNDEFDTYSDADGIAVDRAHFPDSNFRSYISENFDTDSDGVLSESEIAAVKDIEFINQKFESMEGIEYFTQLDSLRISDLDISEIDVSKNTNLRSFDAVNSDMLKRVVLPEGLAVLSIDYCPVSEMDLTSLTDLESLAVNSIDIHSFDLSNNTKLTTLDIRDTTLTDGIDISANTALKTLVLSKCGLTSVDLSANKALTNVNLSKNSLAAVDLTNCTAASVTLATHGNTMNIGVVDGEYDLKKLADYGLDVSRMLHISGAKLKDSTLYDFEGDTVIYNYDTGRGEATFNLKAEKVLNNGYYVYLDYDSYTNNENGVSCAAWSDVVKAMTDRNSDYYIVLRRDVAEQNITFPTTAKSFTLVSSESGEAKTLTISDPALTLPVNTSFVNVKIESTAAKGFTVTAKKDLEVNGFFSDTLTALNGTASSKLTIRQYENTETNRHYNISYAISKFGSLLIDGLIVFREDVDATDLEFETQATANITDGTFTVTNIQTNGSAYISYIGENFTPITVNGNVTLSHADSPILFANYTDDRYFDVGEFTNGAVLANAKIADASVFGILDSSRPSEDSTLVKSGSQIKVGEPTFELKYGDKTETFSFWDDLIAYINANPYKAGSHIITVLKDADIGSFTMPQNGKYNELLLQVEDQFSPKQLTFSGDIELTGDLQLRHGIRFASKNDNGYRIKLNGRTLTLFEDETLSDAITEVYDDNKGAASSILTLEQSEITSIDYAVNNIGILTIKGNTELNNTVNVRELDAGTPVYIGNKAVTVQDISFSGTDDKVIAYTTNDFVPITITGTTSSDIKFALVDSSDHSVYKKFENGKTLLISSTVALTKLKLADNSKPTEDVAFVRDGSEVKLSKAKYRVSRNGSSVIYSFALWSDVLDYINGRADPTGIYYVAAQRNDDIGGAFVMPKAGTYSSLCLSGYGKYGIKFTGDLTLTGITHFANIALESNKDFTITTNYFLSFSGLTSSTLTAVNGSGKNDLTLYGNTNISKDPDTVSFTINKFNNVTIRNKIRLANTLKATNLCFYYDAVLYTGKNSVTVTNIVNTRGTICYESEFTPVSVTGKIILGETNDALKIKAETSKFENNTTVLASKTADISAMVLDADSVSDDSTLAKIGSEVKVLTQAFKVTHRTPDKTYINDGKFALWSDVIAVINDGTADYEVELLDNADINGAFTMPKAGTFGSLTISGGIIRDLTLTFTGNIVLTGETTFYNIDLESVKNGKPANFTITANYDLDLTSMRSSTLTAIKGSAKSALSLYGNDTEVYPTEVNAPISGFGKVKVYNHIAFTNTVKATGLMLDDNSSVQIFNKAVSFTNVTADGSAQIIYRNDNGAFKPMTVTGDIIGSENSSITIAYSDGSSALIFDNNTTVLTAKKADLSKLKVSSNCVPDTQGSVEYILVRVGSDVKVMPAAFALYQDDPTSLDPNKGVCHGKFALWSDVIATINANTKTNKNLHFRVEVLADADIGGAFTMPKAGTYKYLDISSSSEENVHTLKFTGNITLTGDTAFSFIKLESQKKVKNAFGPANYTITAGNNYELYVNGLSSDTLTAVKGSAKSKLELLNGQKTVDFAVNKFGTVELHHEVEFKNTVNVDTLDFTNAESVYIGTASVTVKNIINADGQTIYYTTKDFKPLNITGDITLTDGGSPIEMIIGSSASYYRFESGATVLTSKTVDLSKIKVADEGIPEKQSDESYSLVRVGSDVKIMPAAFKLSMDVGEGKYSDQGTYELWSDVLAKIAENAKNGKSQIYRVMVLADADIGGAFTMPPANTYKGLLICSDNAAAIRFTGNIKTTGITGFSNIRLESQKKGKNGYEPADFTITSNYDMSVRSLYSDTLKAINGSAKSTMILSGENGELPDASVGYAVNNFGKVTIYGYVVLNNTVKTTTLDLNYSTLFTGKNSVTVVDIVARPNSLIVYTTPEFTPVTVTGDIKDGLTPLVLGLADISEGISYQKFEPNTTVLTAKKADLSKITVADDSAPGDGYTLARVGSDVKIMPKAFKLSHEDVDDGTYALWSDVLAKIAENANADKTNKELTYTVKLLADADIGGAFTMPPANTYKGLLIGSDNAAAIRFTGNIKTTGITGFSNIRLESQKKGKNGYEPADFTITSNYDMSVRSLYSDTLKAINGSAKSTMILSGENGELPDASVGYAVNNFGKVTIYGYVVLNNTVKTTTLDLNYSTLFTGKNSVTVVDIVARPNSLIVYTTPEFTPVTVTGDIKDGLTPLVLGLADISEGISYQTFEPNTTILTAKKADISNIKLIDKSAPASSGNAEYTFARVGSDVKIMSAAFKLSHYKTSTIDDGIYAQWSDVLAKIAETANTDKEFIYTVQLLADADIGGAFTMPKAGTYKAIELDSYGSNTYTLKFTGNVTAASNIYFGNIKLESQKNGSPANFTITTKYDISINGLSSDTLTAINGSAKSTINFNSFDMVWYTADYAVNNFDKVYINRFVRFNNTVKTKDLSLNTNATLFTGKNSVTAENIIFTKNASIAYAALDFTPVTVTGEIIANSGTLKIAIYNSNLIPQKFEPNMTVLIAKKADISNVKIDDDSLPEKQGEAEYTLARVGSDVKIMPAAFKLSHFDQAALNYVDDGAYALWSDVLAEIAENAKAAPTVTHKVELLDNADIGGAFTMPKAGTYGGLWIVGNEKMLCFTGNITTTGKTHLQDIHLESLKNGTPANFTITANGQLTIDKLFSEKLTAINGSANSEISFASDSKTPYIADYAVNSRGTVRVGGSTGFTNTVKANSLFVGSGAILYTGKNSITASKLTADGALLAYTTPDFTPVNVTGEIVPCTFTPLKIALVNGSIYDPDPFQKFEPNTTVLKAKTADISTIQISEYSAYDENSTLIKVGSDIRTATKTFTVTADGTDSSYTQWSDVLNAVAANAKAGKRSADYTVKVTSDYDMGGAFKMPAANTYGSLALTAGSTKSIEFTGDLTLTGNFSVSNVVLNKKASVTGDTIVPVKVNIGKYNFKIGENASVSPDANGYSRLSGVSGTGEFHTAGNVAATGGINVGTMCIDGCDISFSGSDASFSGKLSVKNATRYDRSSFSYDKAYAKNICFESMELSGSYFDLNVKNVELGDILASIKGDFISSKIADSDLFTARSDNYLVAVNDDNFVNLLEQGRSVTENYDTLANAVKGIERRNKADATYTLTVRSEREQPFVLPKTGTYNSIMINGGSSASVLTTETDLVFSSSVELTVLTLNKVNSNGEIVPVNMTVNGDLDLRVVSLSRDTETGLNRIGNITGTGSIQLLDDTFIGGKADINIAPYKRIVLGENASFKGSIAPQGSDAVLEYPASVGKNITLTDVTSPLKIKVSDVKDGDVLAKLDYDYTEGDIVFENEDGLVAVQLGNELVAKQATVTVWVTNTTKLYYTFADAVKEIESINDENADYVITVNESQQFVSPRAGSYGALTIMGYNPGIDIVLTTEDDLNVSGRMDLKYITLNKVSSDGRTVPISINFDTERSNMFMVDSSARLCYNSEIKKDCIADVKGGENSCLGIKNDTMISGNVNIQILKFYKSSCTVAFGDDASFTGELRADVGGEGEQVLEYSSVTGKRVGIKIKAISSDLKLVLNVSGVQEGDMLAVLESGFIEGNITLGNNDELFVLYDGYYLVAAKP